MSIKRTLSKSRTYQIGMANMMQFRKFAVFRQGVLSEYGLSSIEWFVLGTIYDARSKGGMRVTDLAIRFDVKSTYITAVVNSLKHKGLATSTAARSDARVRLVSATEGIKQVPVIDKCIRDQLVPLLAGKIDGQELESYLKTLKQLAYAFYPER